MQNEYQGETRVSRISDGEIEDFENQHPISGRTLSVEAISMDPRSIVSMEAYGVFQAETYIGKILTHTEDLEDSTSPNPLEIMSDVEAINEGHDVNFPPMGPSQFQD